MLQNNNTAIIQFGRPVTTPCLVPVIHNSTPDCISEPFMVNGVCYHVTAMSLGTPHGALLVENVDKVDIKTVGAALASHPLFPKGASIVFIQVIDCENIKARLWQRGEGEKDYTPEAAGIAGATARMLQKTYNNKIVVSMGGKNIYVCCDIYGKGVSVTENPA